jgi:hypothetical protein
MSNKEYVLEFTNCNKVRIRMLKIMFKYGENKWWLLKDKETIAYYQLKENTLLVDYEVFHKGVELLFKRPIPRYELLSNLTSFKNDSEQLWDRLHSDKVIRC